jgi:hypothetical protein
MCQGVGKLEQRGAGRDALGHLGRSPDRLDSPVPPPYGVPRYTRLERENAPCSEEAGVGSLRDRHGPGGHRVAGFHMLITRPREYLDSGKGARKWLK